MSIVSIYGTLILQGDLTCDDDIIVQTPGQIIPISNENTDTVYSCEIQDYLTGNGKSPFITSLTSDINVFGMINGKGFGFPANSGPGANSTLHDNHDSPIPIYGATHAGLGYVENTPEDIQLREEFFTLNSLQIDQRSVILSYYPVTPTNVTLDIIKGPSQVYALDYTVMGNILSWQTPRMEPLIEEGDKLRVVYLGDSGRTFPPPKSPYGSYEAPLSIGSGSGETSGGSGVKLIATSGTVLVNGLVTMNGENGISSRSGGGSGGSIWIVAYQVAGSGSITAEGGSASYQYAGGGGGGYITFTYESANNFLGNLSVDGKKGGTEGVIFFQQPRPMFQEKFTGHILNTKWWQIRQDPVTLNNTLDMSSSASDHRSPEVESEFQISGKNIHVELDYDPNNPEPSYHTSYFRLALDDFNWIGVERKYGHMFGAFSLGGGISQVAVSYPYTPSVLRILKTDSTFSLQFVDSSAGPQTILSRSIPELNTGKFKVQIGVDKPSTGHVIEYFRLINENLYDKNVTLATIPKDATNVTLNIVEGPAQYYGYDYYAPGQNLSWDSAVLPVITPLEMIVVDYRTLSLNDILNKWVPLSARPSLPDISVTIVHGGPQTLDVDYYIVNDHLAWNGMTLDGILAIGDILRIEYLWSSFYAPPLDGYLIEGNEIVVQYDTTIINNNLNVSWDNFKIFNGIIHNLETRDPVIYVDPRYGSDSNDGRQLTPLQNLFVATAWAKRNGTVVLYDGTYNPTEVENKNLTLMGAYGAYPMITTANTLDSTESNWENSCLTFRGCGGIVSNVRLSQAIEALSAYNTSYLEVRDCIVNNAQTGIRYSSYNQNPKILGNTVYNVNKAIVLDGQVQNPYVYSNVIYNSNVGVALSDGENFIVSSNTIDLIPIGIQMDTTSNGIVVSNNITNANTGVQISSDSSVAVYSNNFYGTAFPTAGTGIIDSSGNINGSPQYVNAPQKDYHVLPTSACSNAGLDTFDKYYVDRDGVSRIPGAAYDIGAYEIVDATHGSGPYYVSSDGDDYRNNGTQVYPYRTLDKAMSVADSSVIIISGHYDSYYTNLSNQIVKIDNTNLSVTLDQRYSNIDISKLVFVSPNGSDSSVLGGDGTNTGGNGTLVRPYRSIDRALQDASNGYYVVAFSGEYGNTFTDATSPPAFTPNLFTGKSNRVLAITPDRTGVPNGKYVLEYLFETPEILFPNHNIYDPVWTLTDQSDSSAFIREGYLSFSYDGTHPCIADGTFTLSPSFEVQAQIRQAFDPIFFAIHNRDNTAVIEYNNRDWTSTIYTADQTYMCWGQFDVPAAKDYENFFTDYVCVTSDDMDNKGIQLTYLIDDATNIAMNIIGGDSQDLNVDFTIEDGEILWGGYELEDEIKPGDIIRVIYKARGLSTPIKFQFCVDNNVMTIKANKDHSMSPIMKRQLLSDSTSPWSVSFYMNEQESSVDHDHISGRGYVSQFLAVAKEISGTDQAVPYLYKVWRQPAVLYNQKFGNP